MARITQWAPHMSKRSEYQKRMEEHLDLWNKRLEALSAKASEAVKTQFHKELEEWKAAGNAAVAKLTELRAATGDSWDVIKAEMEKIWHAIEAALDQAEEKRRTQEDNTAAKAQPSVTPIAPVSPAPTPPPS